MSRSWTTQRSAVTAVSERDDLINALADAPLLIFTDPHVQWRADDVSRMADFILAREAALRARIDAALDLHRPVTDEDGGLACAHCTLGTEEDPFFIAPWPCATARALGAIGDVP